MKWIKLKSQGIGNKYKKLPIENNRFKPMIGNKYKKPRIGKIESKDFHSNPCAGLCVS